MKVVVVGGGVVGLTTAICVLHDARVRNQRVELEIWAERVSPDVTSDVAGASFIPTEKHNETPRNRQWVADTGAALFAIVWFCVSLVDELNFD
jgi:flavin-dependent dehydrogenase